MARDRSTSWKWQLPPRRVLAPDGKPVGDIPALASDRAGLIELYRAMVLTRAFDAKAVSLQRTGRLGTYASSLGQEAVAVGIGRAMKAEDLLLPSFREQGAMLLRGVLMKEILLYWGGDERGSAFINQPHDFPICVPVASHASQAAGVALAFKLRHERRVAVCVLGDGATSKGDFYEALNIAGAMTLPVVFVINNNQWAISVPRQAQTAASTLAQKGVAAGVPGVQVDGNDAIAVRETVREALDAARAGEGPSLIEAITYRLSDHTTADDATRYRDDAEVSARWKEEPIVRLRSFLVTRELWTKADEETLIADCATKVNQAVDDYLATAPPPATAMFDHLFATLPASLAAQRSALAKGSANG